MNDLAGLQAICVALAQPEASFNFNPLIQSPRRSIDPSLQRAVAELFGCWDESALQIETIPSPESLNAPAGNGSRTLSGRRSEFLALPPGPTSLVQRRSVLLIAAAVVIVVGLSTVIAVTGGFKANQAAATPFSQSQTGAAPVSAQAEPPVRQTAPAAVAKSKRLSSERSERKQEKQPKAEPAQPSQAIKVVMHIENGRVLKASIANPKPGMDSYEALALRIARQRRYPATTTGGETVTISVNR